MNLRTQGSSIALYAFSIIVIITIAIQDLFFHEIESGVVLQHQVIHDGFFYAIVLLALILLLQTKTIQISISTEKVTHKNWLTGKIKEYYLKDIDDFVQYIEPDGPIGCPDIYLMKDQKVFCRIRCEYYSNAKELMEALESGLHAKKATIP